MQFLDLQCTQVVLEAPGHPFVCMLYGLLDSAVHCFAGTLTCLVWQRTTLACILCEDDAHTVHVHTAFLHANSMLSGSCFLQHSAGR